MSQELRDIEISQPNNTDSERVQQEIALFGHATGLDKGAAIHCAQNDPGVRNPSIDPCETTCVLPFDLSTAARGLFRKTFSLFLFRQHPQLPRERHERVIKAPLKVVVVDIVRLEFVLGSSYQPKKVVKEVKGSGVIAFVKHVIFRAIVLKVDREPTFTVQRKDQGPLVYDSIDKLKED
jgi:hypothetical protein